MPRRRALVVIGGAVVAAVAPGSAAASQVRWSTATRAGRTTRAVRGTCTPPSLPCQNDPYYCRAPGTTCCPNNPHNFCAKASDCCAGGRQCCDSTRGQFCCNFDNPAFPGCCDKGQLCVNKQCVDACPPGTKKCGKDCCKPGETCVNGACTSKCGGVMCKPGEKCCPSTQRMPRSRCYDPATQCCTAVGGVLPKSPMSSADLCPDRKPKPGHKAKANGCGPEKGIKVPDEPLYLANFKPACDYHDICYETCNTPKAECDSGFLERMLTTCRARYGSGLRLAACEQVAQAYFEAVATLGNDAYDEAQKAACDCC